jgi:hypothetical protein
MMVPVKFLKTHSPHIAGSIVTLPDFEANQYLTKGIAQKVAVLRFLKHYAVFNPGETAGFGEVEARKIVEKRLAIPLDEIAKAAEPLPEPIKEEITVEIEPKKSKKYK